MDHLEIGDVEPKFAGVRSGLHYNGATKDSDDSGGRWKNAAKWLFSAVVVAMVASLVAAGVGIANGRRVETLHYDDINMAATLKSTAATVTGTSATVADIHKDVDTLRSSVDALQQELQRTAGPRSYKFAVSEQQFPSSLRPPGFAGHNWQDVLADARGQQVSFWMWSGNPSINAWVDGWLAPKVQKLFGVALTRVPQGAPAAVAKVAQEVAAGQADSGGSCDLVWINGVNFANLKTAGHVFGPWADRVPNAANFDFASAAIAYDKGTATAGFEMPYNTAQSVFIYNKDHVTSPPLDVPALVAWAEAHPGKFTYSDAKDFTGGMVVRTFFYHYAGVNANPAAWAGPLDEAKYAAVAPKVWSALKALEPFLFTNATTGVTYPEKHEAVRDLFGAGEIWLEASYDPNLAAQKILNNEWPDTAQSFVLSTGNIANTNFVAIPVNSGAKAAAMVVGNFIAQPEAMFRRAQPEVWGALQSFDPTARHLEEAGWNTPFDYIDTHEATPTVEALAAHRLPELDQSYVSRIEEDWAKYVKNA